jgi:hypothetical protein
MTEKTREQKLAVYKSVSQQVLSGARMVLLALLTWGLITHIHNDEQVLWYLTLISIFLLMIERGIERMATAMENKK